MNKVWSTSTLAILVAVIMDVEYKKNLSQVQDGHNI